MFFGLCSGARFSDGLLLFLGILDSCSGDAVLLTWVKEKLWQYDVHAVMLTALKQDFNKILDGWNTAAKLARILVYVYYVPVVSIIDNFFFKILSLSTVCIICAALW